MKVFLYIRVACALSLIHILDGKTVVKISFAETDTTMEDCLEHYLRGL